MALIHWGVKTSSTILDWTKSPFRPRLNPLEAAQRTVSWLLMVTYSNMIIFLYFYQSSSVWGVQTRTQEHTVATVSGSLNSFYSCDPPYCSRCEQLWTVHTDCRRVQICNFNVQCVLQCCNDYLTTKKLSINSLLLRADVPIVLLHFISL